MAGREISRASDVAELAALARAAGRLGIDTEFMSERRYRALLCLAQIVVPDPESKGGERIEVLDALDELDPAPLAEVLADPEIEIVLHAGWQDVAILRRTWQTEIRNVFDTQIAAGFAGFGTQTGYANLLRAALRVRVADTASFTRWDRRPLTDEQLAYARDDVAHLLGLADDLQRRLTATGRLEWARDECRTLEDASDLRDPETAYERVPRVGRLNPKARAVARELAAWRERTAAAEDRPVGTVLMDAALAEIAKRQPRSREALGQIRGVNAAALHRRSRELLAAVALGLEAPPIEAARSDFTPPDAGDEALMALAQALVRSHAVAAGIAYELIASRDELARVVVAARRSAPEPDVRVLRGWRRELVGDELVDLLKGRRALTVDATGRLHVEKREPGDGERPGQDLNPASP